MGTVTLYLRGDQIGTYSSLRGHGNNDDRVVTLNNTQALGTSDQIYRVEVEQVNDGVTEFQNGQFVTIYDADDKVVMSRTGVRPDEQQGLAGGDEHVIFTGTKYVIDLGGVPSGGGSKVQYTRADDAADAKTGDNDGNLDFDSFPCLAAGTCVATSRGPRPVETLAPGDLLIDTDGVPHRLLWTGLRRLDLTHAPERARPVLIRAGTLGPGRPARDLIVSPQHRIALDAGPERGEVLGPARGLADLPGVRQMLGRRSVTYVALLTERHAVIPAEGAGVETFYPGAEGVRSLGPVLAAEVHALIPGLAVGGAAAYGPPARPFLTMQQTIRLARDLSGLPRAA